MVHIGSRATVSYLPYAGIPRVFPVAYTMNALTDVLEAFPSPALVFSSHRQLHAVNSAARTLFAIGDRDITTLSPDEVLQAMGAVSASFESLLKRGQEDGALPLRERIYVARDGTWIDVELARCGNSMLFMHGLGSGERDRRLAAVGQLAAGVMHDVNNVLNPILAAAYLLQHHAESPDMVRDYAERIRQAAEAGASTAARVGRFIRQEPLQSGTEEPLDLSQVAEELLELVEPMLAQRAGSGAPVQVVRRLAPTAPMRGIRGDIREALFNIFVNAIDALPPTSGRITVRTEQVDGQVAIAIADTGIGMPEHVRERACEPFFSTKGARGSGLGLAEVYGVVSRHRGTAQLESTVGLGTTVTLRFPSDEAPELVATKELAHAAVVPLRILVVEDQEDSREFLARLLTLHGHSVEAVATVAAASEKLAIAANLQYHLLLTDVGLPDGSGWDLISVAKSHSPAIRIGVITGWEPVVRSSEVDAVDFVLRKPLRAAELLSHIAGVRSPAHPE